MNLRYSIDPADTDGGMAAAAIERETDAALTAGADLLETHTCGEQAERSHRRVIELETALAAVRQLLADADRHQNAFIQSGHLRDALATLVEGGEPR